MSRLHSVFGFLQWVCFSVLTLTVASSALAGPPPPHPILETIAAEEATVNAKWNDAAFNETREWFRQLLVAQATASARRAVIDRKLAQIVETGPNRSRWQAEVSVRSLFLRVFTSSAPHSKSVC